MTYENKVSIVSVRPNPLIEDNFKCSPEILPERWEFEVYIAT